MPSMRLSLAPVVLSFGLAFAGGGLPASAAPAAGPAPGLNGGVLSLDSPPELKGYDVAVDGSGTAYVGWIATVPAPALRQVRACVLPAGASTCVGGVLTADAMGPSSASGLRVVIDASGTPTLVWFHDTDNGSVNGPHGGRIATSALRNGALTTPTDIQIAPSFGQLFDARLSPSGAIWTVAAGGAVPTSVEVGPPGSTSTVTSPVGLDQVRLAFAANGAAVLAGVKYGSVSDPVMATGQPSAGVAFPAFAPVPGTEHASLGLVTAAGFPRLLTKGIGVSPYTQVSSRWTGSAWTKPARTGYTYSCPELGQDLSSDASGRVGYIAYHCGDVSIGNSILGGQFTKVIRFPAGGVVTYTPALATNPSGSGLAVWSVQAGIGNVLHAAWVRLPAVPLTGSMKTPSGRVALTLPGPCLPRVRSAAVASAHAGKGWKVARVTLRKAGTKVALTYPIDGSKVAPGAAIPFKATAVFTKGALTRTVSTTGKVHACATP